MTEKSCNTCRYAMRPVGEWPPIALARRMECDHPRNLRVTSNIPEALVVPAAGYTEAVRVLTCVAQRDTPFPDDVFMRRCGRRGRWWTPR